MREFEQMEIEFFCKKATALEFFEFWINARKDFYKSIGVNLSKIKIRPHDKDELSHYSTATSDVEYNFPFGWKELEGIAYRGDYDLAQHMKFSGKDLSVYDDQTKESYIPHVVECSVGVDRLFLTMLFDSYQEQEVEGETRIVLKLHPKIAPIKAAILPLTKELADKTEVLFIDLKKLGYPINHDITGSIGKRYRCQDEVGTPFCFTYDFDSINDQAVTVRFRDSMEQQRIKISEINNFLIKNLS